MKIYSVSPDLFKLNKGYEDEYESWITGCFQSKWDNSNRNKLDLELELDVKDTLVKKEFDPEILKAD
jgi:hypothetical protein